MKIRESTETEFEELVGGTVASAYLTVVLNSVAIDWLASEDRAAAGIVRRDRDGAEVSYSWGAYLRGKCTGYGFELPSEHDALTACARAMTR
jgi:hypothetical protein